MAARPVNTKVGVFLTTTVHPRVKSGTTAQPNVNLARNRPR